MRTLILLSLLLVGCGMSQKAIDQKTNECYDIGAQPLCYPYKVECGFWNGTEWKGE